MFYFLHYHVVVVVFVVFDVLIHNLFKKRDLSAVRATLMCREKVSLGREGIQSQYIARRANTNYSPG